MKADSLAALVRMAERLSVSSHPDKT
jgi:hypothetical protein